MNRYVHRGFGCSDQKLTLFTTCSFITLLFWANHCLGMVEEAVDEQQGIQPLLDEKGPRHGFMGNGFRRPAAQIVYVYITGIFLDLEYSLHFFNLAESLQ